MTALPGKPVDLPLPPDLCLTLGYPHDARYVAFFVMACTDDLIYDDGASSGTANTWAFSEYRRHQAVSGLLAGYNLGYSDADADHVLLIDWVAKRASVSSPEQAAPFLLAQWPHRETAANPSEAETLTLDELLDPAAWRVEQVDAAAVQKAMDEQRGRVRRMVSWLDLCPDARQEGRGT